MHFSTLLTVAGLAKMGLAGYSLSDDYMKNGFFGNFDFFTGADPTDGYVNYVDSGTAQSSGYTKMNSDGSAYIGVDFTNVASGRGRNSVRLSSTKTYTHMLTVIDVAHMPGGICGTWPAFWSFGNGGSGWPSEGEIDIIEGANDQSQNFMTLHTSPGCAVSGGSQSLIQPISEDCNTEANGNEGCSFHDSNSNSYGAGFNSNGGGVYAMQWTSDGISIWFWPRGSTPSDALGNSPNPSGWGMPASKWAGTGCDWDSHFMDHNLIFDTTFCGSWAANTFQSCSAANNGQTCQAFVQNNPSAFKEAYWQVNALKVYQDNGQSSPSPSPSPSSSPSSKAVSSSAAVSSKSASVSSTLSTAASTTAAASASTSTSTSTSATPPALGENTSGGIFLPASATSTSTRTTSTPAPSSNEAPAPAPTGPFEEEGPDGEVYGPGPVKRAIAKHMHMHAMRDGLASH